MSKRNRIFVLTVGILVCSIGATTQAGIYQGVAAGRITEIDPGMQTTLSSGDKFQLTYTFDASEPDLNPDPLTGAFPLNAAILQLASDSAMIGRAETENGILVQAYRPVSEHYVIRVQVPRPMLGLGAPVAFVTLARWPTEDWLFPDDRLPTSLTLDDFEWATFTLADREVPGSIILGAIDSFKLQPIPEPTTAVLLIGSVLLGCVRPTRRTGV